MNVHRKLVHGFQQDGSYKTLDESLFVLFKDYHNSEIIKYNVNCKKMEWVITTKLGTVPTDEIISLFESRGNLKVTSLKIKYKFIRGIYVYRIICQNR